jgi:hypothetical protein
MCSNAGIPTQHAKPGIGIAAQLARAIDDCAAAARQPGMTVEPDLTARLAALWAMLRDADPELAARADQYTGT